MLAKSLGPVCIFKLGFGFPGLAMFDLKGKNVGIIPSPQIIEYEI